jgi:DNA-binding LacI/PurR family transcriptional regulator
MVDSSRQPVIDLIAGCANVCATSAGLRPTTIRTTKASKPLSKKRISIKDIAVIAGVSHPTVSRALRGEGRISEETRVRIVSIAQELGYTPNLVARGLVMQRTQSIGLVVTNIGDPFHAEVIRGVEHVVRDHGYSLFLASTTADPEQEVSVVRSFHGRNVDGMIIASSQVGGRYAELLDELDIPIVLISSHAEGNNLHSVNHDDYAGATQIMVHLLGQGFRRIAFLGHCSGDRVVQERRRAWQDALVTAGLESLVTVNAPDSGIEYGVGSVGAILARADEIWGMPPDAIFCYNDLLAIGIISGLRRQGLAVPADIAVAGFDGLEVAAHLEPALTTLSQPRYEMGLCAGEMLMEMLTGQEMTSRLPRQVNFLGELKARRSTFH